MVDRGGSLRPIMYYAWLGLSVGVSDAQVGPAVGKKTGVSWLSSSFAGDCGRANGSSRSVMGKNENSELSSSWRGEMGVGKGGIDLGASEGARVGVTAVGPTLPGFILKESDNGGSVRWALR
jgi:hypothetical protein